MKDIKVIIGANFGDEGKGLMTNYFCEQARNNNQSAIVVLHNGGSQRSHTVSLSPDIRHAFRHLGSGTFQGADTYFAEDFIIDPMNFVNECTSITNLGYRVKVEIYANKNCMVSLPCDALINCIKETERSIGKHGSCGCGIYETIKRNQKGFSVSAYELIKMTREQLRELIKKSREYAEKEIKSWCIEHNIIRLSDTALRYYKILMEAEELVDVYINNVSSLKCFNFIDDTILSEYDNVIFEGGQGLLLDQNNTAYFPHLTPSNTGSINPCNIIKSAGLTNSNIELCYVTRTYLTRHGAGPLLTECDKININPHMHDKTNEPNIFQGTLRYGYMDTEDLYKRIHEDENDFTLPHKTSVAVTHLNETDDCFIVPHAKQKIIIPSEYGYYLSSGNAEIQTVKFIREGVIR